MIDHLSLGTHRYADSVAFYRRVLAPLELELLRDTGSEAAFGNAGHWYLFLYPVPQAEAVTARGTHVALRAPSREAVARAHELAMAGAAQDIFSPRTRPDISDSYYGAMFHDLDGHRVEITTNVA
jgi:catechol 2,3-dioxygenase-like lactoylglutathione lyase family enzyme